MENVASSKDVSGTLPNLSYLNQIEVKMNQLIDMISLGTRVLKSDNVGSKHNDLQEQVKRIVDAASEFVSEMNEDDLQNNDNVLSNQNIDGNSSLIGNHADLNGELQYDFNALEQIIKRVVDTAVKAVARLQDWEKKHGLEGFRFPEKAKSYYIKDEYVRRNNGELTFNNCVLELFW